jgi:flagellar FliL protein
MSKDAKPAPEAETEDDDAAPKKTSLVVQIVVFLLITGVAAGAGFGVSMFMDSPAPKMAAMQEGESGDEAPADEEQAMEGGDKEGKSDEDEEAALKNAYAKPLAPILTNLAAPDDVWVRMELAVVGKPSLSDALLEQIHQDLFAYMRTVKLHHVEGPSGYQNLKAELSERAAIRSGGTAQSVLVRTLVFE